jgi:general secretion pathway protein G
MAHLHVRAREVRHRQPMLKNGSSRRWKTIALVGSGAIIGAVLLANALVTTQAKESALKNNLYAMITVIDKYTYDKKSLPRSLQDLITKGYLRDLPTDPMTGSNRTWRFVKERAIDGTDLGIIRVRSGSDKIGTDGRRYSDW